MNTLYDLLQEQAEKKPNQIAVVFGDNKLTYGEFIKMVNIMSNNILGLHIENKGIVVNVPKSAELLALLFAIVNTNNYYIPVDMAIPQQRKDYIIENSNASHIVIERENAGNDKDSKFICMDQLVVDRHFIPTKYEVDLNHPAYCIYTSGSTGNPKGVMISQASVVNFIKAMKDAIDLSEIDNVLCVTTHCFDIFFLESIMSLCLGLKVILADDITSKYTGSLKRLMEKFDIDLVQMTPSRVQLLLEVDPELDCLKKTKVLLLGGETLPANLFKTIKEKISAKIYNMYGPTETTIWSMVADLTNREDIVIGKPILNTQIYVLDDDLNPVDAGTEGEICIAGAGLAIEYLNDTELTKKQFVQLADGTRIYRTGDYGKYDAQKDEYIFIGRKDNQIKLNGFRVEIEEIENAANMIYGVKQNIVEEYIDELNGTKKLCMYYTADDTIAMSDIVNGLLKLLPEYMIPNKYIKVDKFIYTPNGKLDRKNLSEITNYAEEDNDNYTEEEKIINDIIFAVSGIKVSEENKDVIMTMINSLEFISLVVKIEKQFGLQFEEDYLIMEDYTSIDMLYDYVNKLLSEKEE